MLTPPAPKIPSSTVLNWFWSMVITAGGIVTGVMGIGVAGGGVMP